MADVTIKQIDELDYYKGDQALPDIKFRTAGGSVQVLAADVTNDPDLPIMLMVTFVGMVLATLTALGTQRRFSNQ